MYHEQRMKQSLSSSPVPGANGFAPAANTLSRPTAVAHPRSDPLIQAPSLGQRRANKFGMTLSDMGGGSPASPAPGLRRANAPKLSDMSGGSDTSSGSSDASKSNGVGSKLDDFKKYIDADKGWITFDGAATITRTGVNFANGQTFSISLDEVETIGELGKGNYGTVYKVRHAKPAAPRFGHGLSGVRMPASDTALESLGDKKEENLNGEGKNSTTGKVMAMKEIRLELDDAKFSTILKELVILHECVSPYIIDFYGAFFQEGAVYMCIEYMDGGSIDKLYKGGIPEDVLRKITYSTVMGLKSLKDEHNIIHRDVKPTNILVNTRGQVKICDFGVSGNLVASIAKTNIGCQSYMAPERISGSGGSVTASAAGSAGTYSVQSDIWSLGLTIIECAMGRYPYPPEVSSTIFSQLSAIVEGDPPDLPKEGYSETAQSFVSSCLHKIPKMRATYAMLLSHPWLKPLSKPSTITEEDESDSDAADAVGRLRIGAAATDDEQVVEWVTSMLGGEANSDAKAPADQTPTSRPALHAAPLDTVSPLASPVLPS